jgi:hypothetical protein
MEKERLGLFYLFCWLEAAWADLTFSKIFVGYKETTPID